MKYACIQQYFDNGKIKAFVQPAKDDDKDVSESRDDYNLNIDIFDTKEAAEDWARQARKA